VRTAVRFVFVFKFPVTDCRVYQHVGYLHNIHGWSERFL